MSSNFAKEFCSRLLIFFSASFVPGFVGVFQTRYPYIVSMFNPKFILSMIGIFGGAFLLRLGGLRLRGSKEIIWVSFYETLGYGIASMMMVLFWLPTRYPDFLDTVLTNKFWTKNIHVLFLGEFLVVCLGVLMTFPNLELYKSRRRGKKKSLSVFKWFTKK
jgi:hypothetical protein